MILNWLVAIWPEWQYFSSSLTLKRRKLYIDLTKDVRNYLWLMYKQAIRLADRHMMTSSNGNIFRYWPFVRGIHRSPLNSPHKGRWRGALMFHWSAPEQLSKNRDAGDWLRRHRAPYDVTVMMNVFPLWSLLRLRASANWITIDISWWRHQMEIFSTSLAICAGNSPIPVNSPHKGQWRGALMFSFICARINGWLNNHEAGDLRRYRAHHDATVM